MKEAKAKALKEAMESEYEGLCLSIQTTEFRGTFGVMLSGGLTEYQTRYIFGTEDRDDLEEEIPLLREFRLFRKEVTKWAKRLVTSDESSPYTFTSIVDFEFGKVYDSFLRDCPECSWRKPEEKANRITSNTDRCYSCSREYRKDIGEVCRECERDFAPEGKTPNQWQCQGHVNGELIAALSEE